MVNTTVSEILVCLKINVLEKSEVFLNALETELGGKIYNYIIHVYSTYLLRVNLFVFSYQLAIEPFPRTMWSHTVGFSFRWTGRGFKGYPIHPTSISPRSQYWMAGLKKWGSFLLSNSVFQVTHTFEAFSLIFML